MTISMIMNGEVIEKRLVSEHQLKIQGYVDGLVQDMLEKYDDIMDLSKEPPQFYLEETSLPKKTRH